MNTSDGAEALGTTTPEHQSSKDLEWTARMAEADRQWQLHRDREAEVLPLNKAAVFDALGAAGISLLVVNFDGSGDSGQIEDIAASGPDGTHLVLPDGCIDYLEVGYGAPEPLMTKATVREVVENLSYAFLSTTHGGWENDDGAYGEFTFDVAQRGITLEYNERYTDTHFHEHQF